ncbi:MAG TPA: hypothetical protein VIC59_10500 [Gemmatimonadota bacterium]
MIRRRDGGGDRRLGRLGRLGCAAPLLLGLAAAGCSSGNEALVSPGLRNGMVRLWEVSEPTLPNALDVFSGRRLFLGSGDVTANFGDFFVDGAPGSTDLRLRSLASLLLAESVHVVGLQDLGAIDFDGLVTAPSDGYLDSEDSTGVSVVAGHVYVLRITRTNAGDNFAKLVMDGIGGVEGDPDSQFIDFHYVIQTEPGNRRFDLQD